MILSLFIIDIRDWGYPFKRLQGGKRKSGRVLRSYP